ncbi:MAG: cytochrome B [Legionellales bacterium RIFCSPHIGHO2_12_FULL_42_9]|nr:MAG: cytochrome B [Legionellales bacterium RIFCSPHIGHO2_12_FULL_42_9]
MKKTKVYSPGSKLFHWLIALIVLTMLSGSFFLNDLPLTIQATAIMFHKSFGLTVLLFMILRSFWIIYRGKPALPPTVARWERALSHAVQYSLYLLLFLMPICGWVMSVAADKTPSYFGLFKVPLPFIAHSKPLAQWMFAAHQTIAWIIITLLFLHISGALKHYFIDRDKVLQRMWFEGAAQK